MVGGAEGGMAGPFQPCGQAGAQGTECMDRNILASATQAKEVLGHFPCP